MMKIDLYLPVTYIINLLGLNDYTFFDKYNLSTENEIISCIISQKYPDEKHKGKIRKTISKKIRKFIKKHPIHMDEIDYTKYHTKKFKNKSSMINRHFKRGGKRDEHLAIEQYQKHYECEYDEDCILRNKAKIYKRHDTYICIRGRCDAMLKNNKRILEVKTRYNKLLDQIPIHEYAQMQLYMWLYDVKKCVWIQQLCYDKHKSIMKWLKIKKSKEFIKLILRTLHKLIAKL
jgi:hypothetical protein